MHPAVQAEESLPVPSLWVLASDESAVMYHIQEQGLLDYEDLAGFEDEGLAIKVAQQMAHNGHSVRVIKREESIIWPDNKDIEILSKHGVQ